MKPIWNLGTVLALPMFLSMGCSHSADENEAHQEELAAKIEDLVELPDGAAPIESYGRNYAMDKDGKVIGAYSIPHQPRGADDGCSVWASDGLRPCTHEERLELVQGDDEMIAREARQDESRWFEDVDELPIILDGGCDYITVTYNPKTEYITAECNGHA